MKKFLFLAFAISLMLFCSASHEAFSGVSPPTFNGNKTEFILTNDFTIYNFNTNVNDPIIKSMQYRSSLWI